MVLNFWLETFILLLHILKFFMFLPMNIYYARNIGSKSAYNIFWLFIYGFPDLDVDTFETNNANVWNRI